MSLRTGRFGKSGALALMAALASFAPAAAAERPTHIFDTEIENTIRTYAAPVLRAAGLDAEAVRIHLIRANVLNAFVARGQRLFLTTGLIEASESPGQLIGVLAHETGHIAGGHLARLDTLMQDAATPIMVSSVIAVVAAILTQNPAAAAAVSGGTQQAVTRNVLSFTRAHERSADRAAISYLEATQQSAKGLLEFLEILDNQQALIVSRRRQQELSYDVTHPLTRDRIVYIRDQVERSRHSATPPDPALVRAHRRIRAKLKAFLNHPGRTLREFRADDPAIEARYARVIAYFRQGHLDRALTLIDGLIAEHRRDPYFLELKGQVLFENGRVAQSLAPIKAAVRLLPDAPLIRIGLAHAQIETNRRELLDRAIDNLEAAIRIEATYPLAWRLAATAYGRKGDRGRSALASAEYGLLTGRRDDARRMAKRAQRLLARGSPGWLRAADVLNAAGNKRR